MILEEEIHHNGQIDCTNNDTTMLFDNWKVNNKNNLFFFPSEKCNA